VRKPRDPLWFFLFAVCWRWKLLIKAGEEWPDPALSIKLPKQLPRGHMLLGTKIAANQNKK